MVFLKANCSYRVLACVCVVCCVCVYCFHFCSPFYHVAVFQMKFRQLRCGNALCISRNIVGGTRSIGNDTYRTSPILPDAAPPADQRPPVVSISEEQKAELERKTIAILKEFLEIKDFKVSFCSMLLCQLIWIEWTILKSDRFMWIGLACTMMAVSVKFFICCWLSYS